MHQSVLIINIMATVVEYYGTANRWRSTRRFQLTDNLKIVAKSHAEDRGSATASLLNMP